MKSSLPCWLLVLSIIAAPLAAQEIYRVVDEHGNVTYTDQKPDDDADPVNLPEINVLGEDDDPLPVDEPETEVAEPLRFTITSPTEGEVFSELAGDVRVEMEINLEVPPTTQIVIFLNGQPQEPVPFTGCHPGAVATRRLSHESRTANARRPQDGHHPDRALRSGRIARRALMDPAPQPDELVTGLIRVDAGGRISWLNRSAADLLTRSPTALEKTSLEQHSPLLDRWMRRARDSSRSLSAPESSA
jgi:PAS domain-containing protein